MRGNDLKLQEYATWTPKCDEGFRGARRHKALVPNHGFVSIGSVCRGSPIRSVSFRNKREASGTLRGRWKKVVRDEVS